MKVITRDEEETYKLGVLIGSIIIPGTILSLNGDLGAGKTHFTKGLAEGLEVKDYITSPSFTILNEYEGRLTLYHFDVYRIEDISEMYEIGFEDYINGEGVCVIEWGDLVEDMLPGDTVNIRINIVDNNTREIFIKENGKLQGIKELVK
jgi:tRNA threonylcarbamoyladenosine biosynthesis protein TsaE